MKLCIIYRSCEVVASVNGAKRPFGLDKGKVIDVCFNSLLETMKQSQEDIDLIVVGDKISEERRAFFSPHAKEVIVGNFGNGKSIEKTFEIADCQKDDTLLFFCEDDYYFVPQAIPYMLELFRNKEKHLGYYRLQHLFVFPVDYPDRYLWPDPHTRKMANPCLIFISEHCHWRQIPSTTYTFLCTKEAYLKHREVLMRSAPKWDDRLLSQGIYAQEVCVSPMPGLCTHMHEGVMTPLINWENLIRRGPE